MRGDMALFNERMTELEGKLVVNRNDSNLFVYFQLFPFLLILYSLEYIISP